MPRVTGETGRMSVTTHFAPAVKASSGKFRKIHAMAYTATRSERVGVSCNGTGAVGFEARGAI